MNKLLNALFLFKLDFQINGLNNINVDVSFK